MSFFQRKQDGSPRLKTTASRTLATLLFAGAAVCATAKQAGSPDLAALLGARPHYLVDQLREGPLKNRLKRCVSTIGSFKPSDFSIGHRGAALMFPEHTEESYRAAARMGAGIVECDVTFTKDRELVCRHDQCDLHATTDIVATPLAEKCEVPPVVVDDVLTNAPAIQCCTSDITLAEFKTLAARMNGVNRAANSIADYLKTTPRPGQELQGSGIGTPLSHAEAVELFKELGVGMTPELKTPRVEMPYQGDYTQQDYARQLVDELIAAGVDPRRVWLQSFLYEDVLYWIENYPDFSSQVVFLDGRYDTDVNDPSEVAALKPSMSEMAAAGVKILAPPMYMMLGVDKGQIIPSVYAEAAKDAGLDLIGWTTERSGKLEVGGGGFYYSTVREVIRNDGDILGVIDVLAREVGVIGLFSDWPATTTFYANCMSIQ